MKKTVYIIGITISAFLIAFLIWLMVFIAQNGYGDPLFSFDFRGELHIEKEETIEIGDIKNIKLDFVSSDVSVFTTDEDTCKVIQKSNKTLKEDEIFNTTKNNDTIEIKTKQKFQLFSFGFISRYSQIEIYLPKTYVENLSINSISGNITTNSDLILNYLEAKTVSGDIISNYLLNTQKYTFSTVSGDIKLDNLLGMGSMTTVSGDFRINTFNTLDNSTIKTTSGDINLSSVSIEKNLNINTISGNVTLNFTPNANCKINYSTVSGDISYSGDIILRQQ